MQFKLPSLLLIISLLLIQAGVNVASAHSHQQMNATETSSCHHQVSMPEHSCSASSMCDKSCCMKNCHCGASGSTASVIITGENEHKIHIVMTNLPSFYAIDEYPQTPLKSLFRPPISC